MLLLEAGSAEPLRGHGRSGGVARPDRLGGGLVRLHHPQADAGMLLFPQGRGLGGGGAVNAMAHVRGHRAVYDAWEAGGATGWGYDSLLPYFKGSEHAAGRDPVLRGPAARSGSPRCRKPAATRPPARSPRHCARSASP